MNKGPKKAPRFAVTSNEPKSAQTRGISIVSLSFGATAFALGLVPALSIGLGLVAIILAIMSIKRGNPRRIPSVAIGLGVIGAFTSLLTLILLTSTTNQSNRSSGAGTSDESSTEAQPETRVSETPTNSPGASSKSTAEGCLEVADSLLAAIGAGVTGLDNSNSVIRAAAVKSPDFAEVWFVAAEIAGPGIEKGEVVGVWATNRGADNSRPGLIMSVDPYAKAFSDWGDAASTDAKISAGDRSVDLAKACLN